MSKRKSHYMPGDWIAVPLQGGWAVGLIARMGRYGACLGYFFGPLLQDLPKIEHLSKLRPEQAIFVRLFLSAQLQNGEWPVLGRLPEWNPSLWPVPKFRIREASIGKMSDRWIIRTYDDNLEFGPEKWGIAGEAVQGLPDDGTSYGGALQLYLADLLGTRANVLEPFTALPALGNEAPRHFIYFHDKELANHAAEACRVLGYEPAIIPSVDESKPYLLLANVKAIAVTEEEMDRASERLKQVAAEWGGEYDGWDRPA